MCDAAREGEKVVIAAEEVDQPLEKPVAVVLVRDGPVSEPLLVLGNGVLGLPLAPGALKLCDGPLDSFCRLESRFFSRRSFNRCDGLLKLASCKAKGNVP